MHKKSAHKKNVFTIGGVRRVAPEWLPLSSQIGSVVNQWSSRTDLTAYIGKDGGMGLAAALFDPEKREIEINTIEAFGEHTKPTHVGDFTERVEQLNWPKAAGFIAHEAAHAAHSTVSLRELAKELNRRQLDTYQLLDESRIEKLAVDYDPHRRIFLRASALALTELTKEEIASIDKTTLAVRILLLAHARIDADVLEPVDVAVVEPLVDGVIDKADREAIRKLYVEFQGKDDRIARQLNRMKQIAIELTAIIEQLHKKNNTQPPPEDGDPENSSGSGAGGGDGSGGTITPEQAEQIMDAINEAAARAETQANREATDEKIEITAKQKRDEQNAKKNEKKIHVTISKNTFERSIGPNGSASSSRVQNRRPPTSEERVAANRIGQALVKAKYRDRIVTESRTALPPGRLNVGQAMQGKASRMNGGDGKVEPWHKTTRRHVEDPNLALGLMCDISGSMGGTMKPMATAAWIMSEAAKRIDGKIAAVYYGNDIFPVIKPGEYLKEVTTYTASDGSEEFDKAFKSLNGALNLLDGSGARLLIICSDGNYRPDQAPKCEAWLKRCKQEGVAVVWFGFKQGRAEDICARHGVQYVVVGDDVLQTAQVIGDACIKALTKAGATRAG